MEINNKNILIVGLGVSGSAAARFLKNRGASVTVTDMAAEKELTAYASVLRELNIRMELGQHRMETFEKADLIILSPGVPHTIFPVKRAQAKGIPVFGEIELAYRFIREPIIAVTGTNGKTTTTTLLGEMLKNSGMDVFVGGNIGNPLIGYADQKEKADIIVAELSSFQLDTIDTFRPKVAVVLNITEDHLDRYPDFTAYVQSKGRIFENQQADDIAVLNGSDSYVRSLSKKIRSKKLFFNAHSENEKGATIHCNGSQNDCRIIVNTQTGLQSTLILKRDKLPGKHNLENIAAACLAASAAGADPMGIQSALEKFKGLPHRLEYVDTIHQVMYFDDSKATNVDSVFRALECFDQPIILIMGGRDKGGNFEILKNRLRERTKALIAIGESKNVIRSALKGITAIQTAETMEEAVFLAHRAAAPGDVVLLSPACSSFDMYRSYAHRGEIFCHAVKELKRKN
ncbi:MAG: UDP-N-acetylmuramoyl-L-alanine--D-glutamate ligase [Desulfobacterales bacterium]|nr:UDP-N-acetylmuramoyl-L-alanine--D-glutamate ligase [Desulfobacterales bacterium]